MLSFICRWWDKCVQLIISESAVSGANVEHSILDATVSLHLLTEVSITLFLKLLYTDCLTSCGLCDCHVITWPLPHLTSCDRLAPPTPRIT